MRYIFIDKKYLVRQKSYAAKFSTAKIPEASFPTEKIFTANVPDTKDINSNKCIRALAKQSAEQRFAISSFADESAHFNIVT